MLLQGKRILLGITGSIAAYKAAHLTRLLVKEGAEVQIIMSTSALDFITPLTLATLSKKPVLCEFQDSKNGEWNNHVELGLWADLFLIAPISANTLAKFANGSCDNLLTATYLSAKCPVMIAPAMDLDMYQHPSVKVNLSKVSKFGNIILEAEEGELASGLLGQGRLMEPEHILEKVLAHFESGNHLYGKKFLITAGPTYEAIDPVRFIGNHSSGKMGVAIAEEVARKGAHIILVLGPSSVEASHPNINTIRINSAAEMYETASSYHQNMDCCIFAAAVADYAPVHPAKKKIKKKTGEMSIPLKKNIDIACTLGALKKDHQVHIGFALETHDEEINAKEKLEKKNFDIIVLNSLKDAGAGFKHNTNKVTFFYKNGEKEVSELLPKNQIAALIVENIKKVLKQ
ncbi:MAG: bifunctional phosphopantothenoylcysteine decarboxylase/phosphopantothenate--cysteine ligase CoaBC [Anditalea sp.]